MRITTDNLGGTISHQYHIKDSKNINIAQNLNTKQLILFDVFNLCTRQAIARWVKNGCSIRLARECASKNIEYARKIKKLLKEVKGETNEKD